MTQPQPDSNIATKLKALFLSMALLTTVCLTFWPAGAQADVCFGCREFFTDPDSAGVWLRDGDPKQASATQMRGTLPSLRFGSDLFGSYHLVFQDTLVFTGDTNTAGNGIPAGDSVVACTLWLAPTSLYFEGTDTIVYDLYSIDQPWNENDGNAVSWSNRTNNTAWTQAGVTGTLKTASAITMVRQDANSYKWFTDVAGSATLWDSVVLATGDSVPIPLPVDLANNIHQGVSYGFVLRLDTIASLAGVNHAFATSENSTVARRPQFQWVSTTGTNLKIVFVDNDTTSLDADTLMFNYVRDYLRTFDGGKFIPEWMDDLQARNYSQAAWDSIAPSVVVWTASSFGGYDMSSITFPIITFNRNQQDNYGLGSASNTASASQLLLKNGASWLSEPIAGDTVFSIVGSNLSFGQSIGTSQGDLQPLVLSLSSAGPDTAVVVIVDSAGILNDGVASAPNRRAFSGISNPNLWSWSHGWDVIFKRLIYFAVDDTTNTTVRNEIRVTDHFLQSTWFEIGSCNMAAVSSGATIRPGYDNGQHVGGLVRYDSLLTYIGSAPTDSSIVIDSVEFSLYLTGVNAYNIQGGDSSFDFRLYVTRLRRQVAFNPGASTYDGTTCGVSDTASTTNHWGNRFTPAYPSTSRDLWASGFGSALSDSAWSQEAARDTARDIHPWASGDTIRANVTSTPPDSWTTFPVQTFWFQDIVDGASNLGFAIGQDTIYDTSNCELNYRGPVTLPTTDNSPRLTLWWSYAQQSVPPENNARRRRVLQQTAQVDNNIMRAWGFTYQGRGRWEGIAETPGDSEDSANIALVVTDYHDRLDVNADSTLDENDLYSIIRALLKKDTVESIHFDL
jgi:hypothetical protein